MTVDNTCRELTSSEAGFLYAAGRTGGGAPTDWGVDDIGAGPLVQMLDEIAFDDFDGIADRLEDARIRAWNERRQPARSARFSESVARSLAILDGAEDVGLLEERLGRRSIRRASAGEGGDVSVVSRSSFDLRRWFEEVHPELIGLRLVAVGAALVSGLDRLSVRRRLAAMFQKLPKSVRDEIESVMAAMPPLDDPVARRVYEVYGRLASKNYRSDEEFALLGLFFVVSAAVFRQNRLLDRLENMLSEELVRRCRKYRRACLKSGKRELESAIAEVLHTLFEPGQEPISANAGQREIEDAGGDDE